MSIYRKKKEICYKIRALKLQNLTHKEIAKKLWVKERKVRYYLQGF